MSVTNNVDWFQIGTDQPAAAERFYGDVFGWTFAGDDSYRLVTTPGAAGPGGGLVAIPAGHAIFYIHVADVAEACRAAEAAGGKVLVAPQDGGSGLIFAHLLDPGGNHIGVYAPVTG